MKIIHGIILKATVINPILFNNSQYINIILGNETLKSFKIDSSKIFLRWTSIMASQIQQFGIDHLYYLSILVSDQYFSIIISCCYFGQMDPKIMVLTNEPLIQRRNKYIGVFKEHLDPRDRQFILPFMATFNITDYQVQNKELIKSNEYTKLRREVYEYVFEVCENINSISFQMLNEQKLNDGEVKAFAAKNTLANIQSVLCDIKAKFMEHELTNNQESEELMLALTKSIDEKLKDTLSQLACNYPQAPAAGATPRMKEVIVDVNRSQDQNNDFIFANDIRIDKYIASGEDTQDPERYMGFVMEIIDKAIRIAGTSFQNQEETLFEKFRSFSESLFYFAQHKDSKSILAKIQGKMKEEEVKKKILSKEAIQFFLNQVGKKQSLESSQFRDVQKAQEDNIEQTRKKYAINQKIPNHVRPFTNADLRENNFYVKSSAVLRIMTKWAEYLQEIFQKPGLHIQQKLYQFKDINNELRSVNQDQKSILRENLAAQYTKVKKELEKMKKTNIRFESYILSEKEPGTAYLKRFNEVRSASSQINTILIEFTRKYLCVLIHHLIKAGQLKGVKVNLIVFRLGDLFRSKLQCSQGSFVNVINTLNLLDQAKQMEGKYKLVRIKNKLNQRDNNVLINYMFMGKVQCQLQLSIQEMHKKDKHYYNFCHFLYELTRGKFGVLTECATIVCQHDPIVSSSEQSYYRPRHYEERAWIQGPTHTIHKKDHNIYKCWKCHQLAIRQNIHLFVESEKACNQCISKQENAEQLIQENDLKQALKRGLQESNMERIKNIKSIQTGKYILSVNNSILGDKVTLFRAWKPKRELRMFLVRIDAQILTKFGKEDFDWSSIDYFDISTTKELHKQLRGLIYILNDYFLSELPEMLLGMMRVQGEGVIQNEIQSKSNSFFKNEFEPFRLEKNLIKSIKFKCEIIDLSTNRLLTELLDQITEASSRNVKLKLRYKKYNLLQYNHIKKIDLQHLDLKQSPKFLDYVNGVTEVDLSQNTIQSLNFDNHLKLQSLWANCNKIKHVSFSLNVNLMKLELSGNYLQSIDLRQNFNLTHLNIKHNCLSGIDLINNSKLSSLELQGNKLAHAYIRYSNKLRVEKTLFLGQQNSTKCSITLLYNQQRQRQKCQKLGKYIVKQYEKTNYCSYDFSIKEYK